MNLRIYLFQSPTPPPPKKERKTCSLHMLIINEGSCLFCFSHNEQRLENIKTVRWYSEWETNVITNAENCFITLAK